MATLVQATCPGCKKLLHIPTAWLSQPIRCKFCGMIMAAKSPPIQPAPAPRSSRTQPAPPPPNRHSNPFGFDSTPQRKRPVRRRSWTGTIVLLLLLGVGAGAGAFYWKPINERLQSLRHKPAVAKVDEKNPEPTPVVVDQPPPEPVVPKPPATQPMKKPEPVKEPAKPTPEPMKKPEPVKEPVKPTPEPMKKPEPMKEPVKTPEPKPEPMKPPEPVVKPDPPPPANGDFPRRALIISVHNYVFANPTQFGPASAADTQPMRRRPGTPPRVAPTAIGNLNDLDEALITGLRIPETQLYHLSDRARDPHPPLRLSIEQTLTAFLGSSRAQDCILVFFIGHAVEIDGKGYLAPIEGDLQNAETLIPLDWVLKRMENCKARQKIFVLDGNRFNPNVGYVRPGAGPMTEKFDALLKEPPPGVQIWSACVAGQQSYEPDSSPSGLFLDSMRFMLAKDAYARAQRQDKLIDIDDLNRLIVEDKEGMKRDLASLKVQQTPRITGKPVAGGAPYDANQSPPPPVLAVLPPNQVGGKANQQLIDVVFTEIRTPPVKPGKNDILPRADLLPPFSQVVMDAYKADEKPDSELRKAVLKARAALWAISTQKGPIPAELAEATANVRKELQLDLSQLVDFIRFNPNENQFKAEIKAREEKIARIILMIKEVHEELVEAKKLRKDETKRWQANYDFTLARVEAQYAYLFEYQSMLGQMKKEAPPKDKADIGWVLASSETLTGDSTGKKLYASSRKLLDQIATDNAGTPWEILARREKFTALGLEWKATR